MNRITWLLGVSILGVSFRAWASASAPLLASSGESLTLECRREGLYFAYQLDGLPACYEFACTAIQARTDDGQWVQYAAHNGSNLGFIRNKHSTVRKNGADAEALLVRMLKASRIELPNPGTGKPVAFSISDTDRAKLVSIAAVCGT